MWLQASHQRTLRHRWFPQISRVKLEESRRAIAGQDDVVDARHRKHKFKTVQNKVDHMLKRLNEQVRCAEGGGAPFFRRGTPNAPSLHSVPRMRA